MHLPIPTHRRMLASAYIYTIMNIYKCIEHTRTHSHTFINYAVLLSLGFGFHFTLNIFRVSLHTNLPCGECVCLCVCADDIKISYNDPQTEARHPSWACGHTPVITALRRQRQEDQDFQTKMGYMGNSDLNKTKQNTHLDRLSNNPPSFPLMSLGCQSSMLL